METFNSNHTAAFFRLVDSMRRAKKNNRPFCLFIGAGCSLSSSLSHSITTEQIIKDCLIRNLSPDYQIPSNWEQLYRDFVNKVWKCLAAEDRREILYECFKNLTPSIGYKYLKLLIENGYVRHIITTNFDMLIDDTLCDLAHNVKVSNLPIRRVKGGSNISLLKVHGDIENGNLRFSPDELVSLPDDISKEIRNKSNCSCLVCGYRGQDQGVMNSLSTCSDYTAFWAAPNRPSEFDYFENSNIYDWMQARNSKENFIYGDILGSFDQLMQKLVEILIGTDNNTFLPNCWENNIVTNSIKVNEKSINIFCNLVRCSEDLSKNYEWHPLYPFYAENYQSVLDAYLFFYRNQSKDLPSILQLPENEIESLLIAVAIEIAARTSGIHIGTLEYAKKLEAIYQSQQYHYYPDKSFWDALYIVLSSMEQSQDDTIWESIEHIKLNMNCGGRLALDIKKPMLRKMARVLNALNLCGMLCPTSENLESLDVKAKYKKILESKSLHIDEENNILVLHFDNMSACDYENVYEIFFKNHQAILSGSAIVLQPAFLKNDISFEDSAKTLCANLSEYIVGKSHDITNKFLKLKTAFDFDSTQYINTPTEDAIYDFLKSLKSGMFLIGSSGSGKTKSIQHFCKENVKKYIIAATTPKCCRQKAKEGLGLFFQDLTLNNIYTQEHILKKINDVLQLSNRQLVLIYDGLNEISSNLNICVDLYQKLIFLMEMIHQNNFNYIKVIVSCRDLAFLDYCNEIGLYPQPEFCYCNTDVKTSVPYYQIPPLSLELQIKFCKLYIRNKTQQEAFITDLKNNRYIQNTFTHPYLIAIAGSCYNGSSNDVTLLVSNVFSQFTQQMLKRLTSREDELLAIKVINTYFSILISSQSKLLSITSFLLLSSDELYQDRVVYSRILKELQDINLFTKEESNDSIRISHDRIEEYLLSNFLYNSLGANMHVNNTVALATTDSIFSCALQSYFDRCITNNQHAFILDNLSMWYNINPQIIPLLFVCAIRHLDVSNLQNLISYAIYNTSDASKTLEIIFLGLKQALSLRQLEYPYRIFEALNILSATNSFLLKYKSYWSYIASKYYNETQNNYEKAIYYCEESLKSCDQCSDLHQIVSLQLNILKCDYNCDIPTINIFKNLYEYFRQKNELEYAAECVIHWGSFLRKCSKFEEALEVYKLIDPSEITHRPQLCSSLLRKKGTAHKNILQRIIRELKKNKPYLSSDMIDVSLHYKEAVEAFELAKKQLQHCVSVEMLTLLSEMTETAIIVIPFMPEQRFSADIFLLEEEKMLSYIPIPEQEVRFMRNKARLLELDNKNSDAICTLVDAKKYTLDTTMSFRLFEINYQLSRLIMRKWDAISDNERLIGVAALKDALNYPLDINNEYHNVLIDTENAIKKKMQI